MKSANSKVTQSESELAKLQMHEVWKQTFHEDQEETRNLLQNYKQFFSESQLKNQKWWQFFTREDNILSLTFNEAADWMEVSFFDGDYGKEAPTEHEVIQALSQDERYRDKLKDIIEHGWKYFFAKSLWDEGQVNLPFPFSIQDNIHFRPMHNGAWTKDPIETARLTGIPITTTSFQESELALAENQLNQAYNTVFHRDQEETTLLLNEYKKHFSESHIKKQEWWSGFTTDDHRISFTFEDAVKWSEPLFCKGFGYDPVPYTQLLHALSKDERYKWEYETLTKYGWEHFVAESLWNKGQINLPFPISMQNSVKFFPLSDDETFIDDPIEMAELMGLPTHPKPDPIDIIEPINIDEILRMSNHQEASTGENKTLKQVLTEPCRVQKKKGYYSYEAFRQMLLTHCITCDKLTDSTFLSSNIRSAIAAIDTRAQTNFHQGDKGMSKLLTATACAFSFISKPCKNIFYLDDQLLQMLSQTEPPKDFQVQKIFLESFLLLLPKNNPLNEQSIFFHSEDNGNILIASFGLSKHQSLVADVMIFGLQKPHVVKQEKDRWMKVVMNFLLWQQSEQDKNQETIELDAPTRQMKLSKNTKQIIVPKVIGEGYKPKVIRNYEPTGTHASPRTHWRSGHWRQQPYGKKDDPKLKTIWLEPVLVNG